MGGDGTRSLHLDHHRSALRVAAEEVDRPGVGEALALEHHQPGLDRLGRTLEQDVDLPLGTVALQHRLVLKVEGRVLEHLVQHDHQRLV